MKGYIGLTGKWVGVHMQICWALVVAVVGYGSEDVGSVERKVGLGGW